MAKLSVFIQGLLEKTGLKMDPNSQEYKDLLNTSVEIDDTLANQLNENLLTVDSAVEHVKVKQRVKAATLDPLDKDLIKIATEAGIDVDDLKAEPNTRIKVAKVIAAIQEAEKKKAGAPSKDVAKYEAEIAKLNGDMKAIRDTFESEKTVIVSQHQSELIDLLL